MVVVVPGQVIVVVVVPGPVKVVVVVPGPVIVAEVVPGPVIVVVSAVVLPLLVVQLKAPQRLS